MQQTDATYGPRRAPTAAVAGRQGRGDEDEDGDASADGDMYGVLQQAVMAAQCFVEMEMDADASQECCWNALVAEAALSDRRLRLNGK